MITDVTLFHGTDEASAQSIRKHGVLKQLLRRDCDFGPGFYTTTSRRQADKWAARRAQRTGRRAAVLTFSIGVRALAELRILAFVRSDDAGESGFWPFVFHCRRGRGAPSHGFNEPDDFHDVVIGPVAIWPPRPRRRLAVLRDGDQYSFHTGRAWDLLMDTIEGRT